MIPTEKRMKANGPATGFSASAACDAVAMFVLPDGVEHGGAGEDDRVHHELGERHPDEHVERASFSSRRLTPRRDTSVARPLARIASTSALACQKNRYGEIVVPRIATMIADECRT